MSSFKEFPNDGVNLLYSSLHMHKRGHSMTVKHLRGGQELEPFPQMSYYDFDLQVPSYPSILQNKIITGDRIVTNGTWDTTKDKTKIVGGSSSEQEMCLNFFEVLTLSNSLVLACCSSYDNVRLDNKDRMVSNAPAYLLPSSPQRFSTFSSYRFWL